MSEQIEYIEPTQEHVGQMVEVRDAESFNWSPAKLVGIASDDYRFTAKRSFDPYGICWKHARIPRPLTYAERQARCGLKVGDRVRFVRAWDTEESGTILRFVGSMQGDIGSVCTIKSITNYSMCIGCRGFDYHVPYFVLEKVEDRVATRDDIGKQVYINGAFGDIFTIDVIFGVEGDLWRAVIRSGDNRLVYELSTLRVKE